MTSFTVAVTVRNDRRGLERLLASLAGQTRAPDELVVVDGGSADGTLEAARAFAERAPFPARVLVEPGTRGRGRDRCVAEARGDVVVFVDSDCVAPPDWLARYAEAWAEAAARGERVGALGGPNHAPPGSSPFQAAVDDVMSEMEARSFHGVNTINCSYLREAVLAAGGFTDLQTAEDPDLNARVARAGYALRRVDNPVAHERRATWRALVRQHYAYGEGGAWLLEHHPEYFPAVERWVAPAGAVGAVALVGLGLLVHPGFLAALALLVAAVPLVVHREFVARFWRAHGASAAFLRRLGVLWVVYAPYQLGVLAARLPRRAPKGAGAGP